MPDDQQPGQAEEAGGAGPEPAETPATEPVKPPAGSAENLPAVPPPGPAEPMVAAAETSPKRRRRPSPPTLGQAVSRHRRLQWLRPQMLRSFWKQYPS